jgi:hypothetical protein
MIESIRCTTPNQDSLIILDARPQINATVNRGAGGGYENTSIYTRAILQFQGIGNIHVVSDALNKVWELCRATESGQVHAMGRYRWAREIEKNWLTIISTVLNSTCRIVQHIFRGRSCFIHCSDGWDRTPLLTSLSMLCLDPYYRTLKGFAVLIEKEWLSTGHPFSLRYGNPSHLAATTADPTMLSSTPIMTPKFVSTPAFNTSSLSSSSPAISAPVSQPAFEAGPASAGPASAGEHGDSSLLSQRSPTFTLFLDCVYQIMSQRPELFEFNSNFLRALGHHLVSCRFGTFLCDTDRERKMAGLDKNSLSFWAYVQSREPIFLNPVWDQLTLTGISPILPNYESSRLKFWWFSYANEPFGKRQASGVMPPLAVDPAIIPIPPSGNM